MKTATRRSVGVGTLLVSLLLAIGLYVSGTPLLSLQQSDTLSSDSATLVVTSNVAGSSGTGVVVLVYWPLIAVGICAAIGLVALAWPQRKPPRLQA
jgi:hypothetical protein